LIFSLLFFCFSFFFFLFSFSSPFSLHQKIQVDEVELRQQVKIARKDAIQEQKDLIHVLLFGLKLFNNNERSINNNVFAEMLGREPRATEKKHRPSTKAEEDSHI